jgi:TRAP transporter TAXI family solute receptor
MRKALRFLAPLVAALVVTAACNAPRASSTPTPSATGTPNFTGKTLNIVTGGTGAVYIVYGAGLAELLNKKLGTAASAQSTTASVDNMKLIRDGKADVAFTLADTAFDAVTGKAVRREGARGPVLQPHAPRRQGIGRHQRGPRPQGQAGLDGLSRQRHRDHCEPNARGVRT